jgi:pilus assembly protein CpaC
VASKILKLILIFTFSFSLFAADEEVDAKVEKVIDIDVPMNIEKIIKFDFVPKYPKIGNEQLVDLKIAEQKKEIMLIGLKPGTTSMTIRDSVGDIKAKYNITVTSSDQTKIVGQLKDLLKDVEGIEIGIKGDKVYIGGQITVPSDIGRIAIVMQSFQDVLFFVELSPHTQLIIAKKMQDEIQKNNFKDVTVRVVNGQFWVEGIVGSKDEEARVTQIVVSFMPDSIQTLAKRTDSVQSIKKNPFEILLTINNKPKPDPIPKLFKITAQFVELTKSYDKVFGFGWSPTISNGSGQIQIGKTSQGGVTSNSNGTLSATISNLIPKLNSAKNAGHARVIQSGIIVVKENIEGTLNKTTEIPYAIGTADNLKAGTAKAGLSLKVTPTMLQEEKVNLKISIAINSVVGTTTPQTLSDSIETQLVVKSQETAVIGGVVSNKTTTDFDKDGPPQETVSNGGYLFSFIKSKNYSTNRSQFVMFVTPEIIESASTGVSEIERKFRKRSR